VAANVVERLKAELTRYPECPGDPTWEFEVLDIASEPIPGGYDLLFSRDALQHLTIDLIIDALENISKTKARYLLVGSYINSTGNHKILMNLCAPPSFLPWPLSPLTCPCRQYHSDHKH
jgi:hypothetical protein